MQFKGIHQKRVRRLQFTYLVDSEHLAIALLHFLKLSQKIPSSTKITQKNEMSDSISPKIKLNKSKTFVHMNVK